MKNRTVSLKNRILVASPDMPEESGFAKSVVYIGRFDEGMGALGFVINRESELTLKKVFTFLTALPEFFCGADCPIGLGGPVYREHGNVIHPAQLGPWRKTICSSEDIAVTVSHDIIVEIAEGRLPGPFCFVIGCCGWGPGQLEEEVEDGDWLVIDASPDLIFDIPMSERWETALARAGGGD